MSEVKRAVVAAVVLAFVAGIGAGAWIGDLRAAGAESSPSIEQRVESYRRKFDLDESEQRRIRDVILGYDASRERILGELDVERWKALNRIKAKAEQDIEKILAERRSAGSEGGG